MAQRQFPFWSLASCIEGLNRNWKKFFYLLQSPTSFNLCNGGKSHGESFLCWLNMTCPFWLHSGYEYPQFTATALTYYFEKQLTKPEEILLLPQCITFGKWPQHVSSRDWLSVGLRHLQRVLGLSLLELYCFGKRGFPYSLGLWSGDLLWQSWVRKHLCRNPLCNSEVRGWKTVSISILQGTNIWLLLMSQPLSRWTACHL